MLHDSKSGFVDVTRLNFVALNLVCQVNHFPNKRQDNFDQQTLSLICYYLAIPIMPLLIKSLKCNHRLFTSDVTILKWLGHMFCFVCMDTCSTLTYPFFSTLPPGSLSWNPSHCDHAVPSGCTKSALPNTHHYYNLDQQSLDLLSAPQPDSSYLGFNQLH